MELFLILQKSLDEQLHVCLRELSETQLEIHNLFSKIKFAKMNSKKRTNHMHSIGNPDLKLHMINSHLENLRSILSMMTSYQPISFDINDVCILKRVLFTRPFQHAIQLPWWV